MRHLQLLCGTVFVFFGVVLQQDPSEQVRGTAYDGSCDVAQRICLKCYGSDAYLSTACLIQSRLAKRG